MLARPHHARRGHQGLGLPYHRVDPQTAVTAKQVNSYLNSNDTQDVPLSFSLLRAIWSLPPAPVNAPPIFARARAALRTIGKLVYNIVMPYICLDMDLSTQLTHLSTAAHLLLDLYLVHNARGRFMPTQTFVNLMIMIKNVFFCVAKAKVDTPDGKFWLILLGTDRLEIFFGLIRTAIGTDTNVDLLQLASRGTNTTEVQTGIGRRGASSCPRLRLRASSIRRLIISTRRPAPETSTLQVSIVSLAGEWAVVSQKRLSQAQTSSLNDSRGFLGSTFWLHTVESLSNWIKCAETLAPSVAKQLSQLPAHT
ncbi:hypothetical protein C8R47DRAFT_1080184 [Mycena vitilis]|nr:hypothetical protein C8R47DRAFT_1080184 [Mycena vitilis]